MREGGGEEGVEPKPRGKKSCHEQHQVEEGQEEEKEMGKEGRREGKGALVGWRRRKRGRKGGKKRRRAVDGVAATEIPPMGFRGVREEGRG